MHFIDEFILKKTKDAASIYIRKKYDSVYKDFKNCLPGETAHVLKQMSLAFISGWLSAGELMQRLNPDESDRLFEIAMLYSDSKDDERK